MKKILTNKGIALVMVLWILTLLSVIVGEFCFTMRTQVNITRNFMETTEAHYIAVAGLNTAIEQTIRQIVAPAPVNSADPQDTTADQIQWRVNTQIPPMPYGYGEYTVWIDNEGGKVNINLADKDLLRLMLNGFDIDDAQKDTIVDSILDWRDTDDLKRLNGAESDYYMSLPVPYECKNGDFDSIEELLLVKGVTPEIFYGGLDQMVTVVPGSKAAPINRVANTKQKKNQVDYNKLNMNAIPDRLWAVFPGMTEDVLTRITEFRKTQNFKSPTDLQEIIGPDIYAGIARYVTLTQMPYFTVHSVATIDNSKISEEIEAVICVTNRNPKNYEVIQWKQGMPPVKRYTAANESQNRSTTKG